MLSSTINVLVEKGFFFKKTFPLKVLGRGDIRYSVHIVAQAKVKIDKVKGIICLLKTHRI